MAEWIKEGKRYTVFLLGMALASVAAYKGLYFPEEATYHFSSMVVEAIMAGLSMWSKRSSVVIK